MTALFVAEALANRPATAGNRGCSQLRSVLRGWGAEVVVSGDVPLQSGDRLEFSDPASGRVRAIRQVVSVSATRPWRPTETADAVALASRTGRVA